MPSGRLQGVSGKNWGAPKREPSVSDTIFYTRIKKAASLKGPQPRSGTGVVCRTALWTLRGGAMAASEPQRLALVLQRKCGRCVPGAWRGASYIKLTDATLTIHQRRIGSGQDGMVRLDR